MKIFLLMLLAFGCGKKSDLKVYRLPEAALSKFVNEKSMPADPNLTLDKSFINHSYPIQIALYKDGQFYYDLPNLGEGVGTWRNSDGKLKLHGKRPLFDMHIEVLGKDEEGESLAIQFVDRFGPNTLEMTNINI